MTRRLAINNFEAIQTIGATPETVCSVAADPVHNVQASGEKLNEGGSMLRVLEDSGKAVGELVKPLIQKAIEEVIDASLKALRARGATAEEAEHERAMLKHVLFEWHGPPMHRLPLLE